jgi:aryl-alcohol dehydrogenase-like predicted oxidoreductase
MTTDQARLGVGTNTFGAKVDKATANRIIGAALEEGVRFIDSAEAYNDGDSERFIGSALGPRRSEAFIATKFSSNSDPRTACEGSLRRLNTDYIDLYQMHAPSRTVPVLETLESLSRLIQEGKVRSIGCSNFAGWQIADADWTARSANLPHFTTAQNRYNLVETAAEQEIVPACLAFGLAVIAYLPLAAGLLTGKYQRGSRPPPENRLSADRRSDHYLADSMFDKVDTLVKLSDEFGISLLSLAIGGLAAMPGVGTVITGVRSEAQIRLNAEAARWVPRPDELDKIKQVARSRGK